MSLGRSYWVAAKCQAVKPDPPNAVCSWLGTRENEFLRECAVSVSHLNTVARPDLDARLLADKHSLRVLVIALGLLFLSVNQYHSVWDEVFSYHDQVLARDRCHSYVGVTSEDELLGEYVVRVSYLETVAGSDLLARLLADQRRPRVLVIILGLLLRPVNQYHRVWVEVFTYHDQLLARDRSPGYFGRRDCGEGVTELHSGELSKIAVNSTVFGRWS